MKGRDKLFFNLLTFLLVVVIGLIGVKTRDADRQIKKWEAEIERRKAREGVQDPILKETVDKLEAALQARLAETFELEEDPLDLTRVVHTRRFTRGWFGGEMPETETRMRLSCTVTSEGDDNALAIIKYRGKSRVLSTGDKIGDYRVETIGVNRVVLRRGAERMKLETEKAPDTIAEEERRYGVEGMKMPIVTVKQIPIGNN